MTDLCAPSAVYGNPNTCRRELWRGGKVFASVSDAVIYDKRFPEMCRRLQCRWADIGGFRPGTVWGEPEAVKPGNKIAKVVP